MSKFTFGLCDASGYAPHTPARFAAWEQLGISRVRFGVDGSVVFANGKVNADGSVDVQPDYAPVDPQIVALRAAGLEINWNLVWLPGWATNGIPAYQRYETGWWDIITGARATDVRYNHPGIDPPHVNPNAIRALATSMAVRWGEPEDTWTFGNEPGSGYWPPSQGDDASKSAAADRFVDEGVLPFHEGVRDVIPLARFVGPEADGADILRRVLQCIKDRGVAPYDEIAVHPYGDPAKWPDDSYFLLSEYWRVMTPDLRQGRPVSINEIDGADLDLWADHALQMLRRDANYATQYDFCGITWNTEWRFVNADDSLTELGMKLQAIAAKARNA